jgi:hypothetical protein
VPKPRLANHMRLTHVTDAARVRGFKNNIEVVYMRTKPMVNGVLKDILKKEDS